MDGQISYWSNPKWTTCGDNIQCTRISVPLDYFNKSLGEASLSVAKYLSTDPKNKLGTVFVNPGGPGGSGVGYVYRAGPMISKILDGRYDVVGWDPRGVNGTTPSVDCFNTQISQQLFSLNVLSPDFSNLSDPHELAAYTSEVTKLEALDATAASLCLSKSSQAMKYVSTATVARDLERLSSILEGPDVPVNYWGFSYGTSLGMQFVNMFPDRVGRMTIDGNSDAVQYTHLTRTDRNRYMLTDVEKVLTNFYDACSEVGEERCALAVNGASSSDISAKVDGLLMNLFNSPLPVPHAKRPGILTSTIVKAAMFTTLYKPRSWPLLASHLSSALKDDGAPLLSTVQADLDLSKSNLTTPETAYAHQAIYCSDSAPYLYSSKKDMIQHIVERNANTTRDVSPHFGGLETEGCANWKVEPAEVFRGPFNRTLANTIVIIGNTADPITPLRNARANHELLSNSSRLLIHNASGHCSTAQTSLCTAKTLKAYFLHNTLPEDGTVCDADEVLFPPDSGSVSALWVNSDSLSDEDVQLLHAFKALGDGLVDFWPSDVRGLMF